MKTNTVGLALLAVAMIVAAGSGVALAEEGGANTGNDPRDFTSKFMPYYRYSKLKNKMKTQDFTVFGMWALSSKFALTYEIPVAREYDITDTDACDVTPCLGIIPGGGNPQIPNAINAEGDGKETGMGDSIIRLFASPDWKFLGGAFIPGVQFTVPTATEEELGTETFSGGPIFTFVWDIPAYPAPGSFFAMMNIFEWDIFKDSSRDDVSHYVGRWFLQLPINKKYKLYILTEFQPVYDFQTDHFSFWFGPEFGKAFAPGKGIFRNGGAVYVKPGWGMSANDNSGDRDWTVELGWRYFFPAPRETWKMMQGRKGG
jgi:hypothetical protein